MDRIYRDDATPPGEGDWAAVPGLRSVEAGQPGQAGQAGQAGQMEPAAFTLEVDGHVFALRPDGRGGMGYDWLSGPNPGYGFGLSPAEGLTTEQHVEHIRDFLGGIGPSGYLDDGD